MMTILPQSNDGMMAVEISGKLTKEDYQDNFLPAINDLIMIYERINLVMIFTDSFSGWEAGAAWEDAKFGLSHRKSFEKMALVGGPDWLDWATKLLNHTIDAEVRQFTSSEQQEALDWCDT